MIPDILNEQKADADVTRVLSREVNKLRRLVPMPLFKLNDGRVFKANEEDLTFLSEEQLQGEAAKLSERLQEVQSLLPQQEDQPGAVPEVPAERDGAAEPAAPEAAVPEADEQPVVVAAAEPEAPAEPIVPPAPAQPEQPGITLG